MLLDVVVSGAVAPLQRAAGRAQPGRLRRRHLEAAARDVMRLGVLPVTGPMVQAAAHSTDAFVHQHMEVHWTSRTMGPVTGTASPTARSRRGGQEGALGGTALDGTATPDVQAVSEACEDGDEEG